MSRQPNECVPIGLVDGEDRVLTWTGRVLNDPTLTVAEQWVACYIAADIRERRTDVGALVRLVKQDGLPLQTVRDAINRLVDAGWIAAADRGRGYHLRYDGRYQQVSPLEILEEVGR